MKKIRVPERLDCRVTPEVHRRVLALVEHHENISDTVRRVIAAGLGVLEAAKNAPKNHDGPRPLAMFGDMSGVDA